LTGDTYPMEWGRCHLRQYLIREG